MYMCGNLVPLRIRLKVHGQKKCSGQNHCSHCVCYGPAYDKSCYDWELEKEEMGNGWE